MHSVKDRQSDRQRDDSICIHRVNLPSELAVSRNCSAMTTAL